MPTQTQGTQAWDRYAFVNNNPVKYNDPTGHDVDGCAIGEYCPNPEEACEYYGSDTLECLNTQLDEYDNPGIYHTENENPPRENDRRLTKTHGQTLTPEEMRLLSTYGISVEEYLLIGQLAKTMAQQLYDDSSSGDQNAFQHTYWSALLTGAFGASFARQAAGAHELLLPNGKKDAFKDAYNNEVGVAIGESRIMNILDLAIAVSLAVARGDTLNVVNGNLQYSGTPQ